MHLNYFKVFSLIPHRRHFHCSCHITTTPPHHHTTTPHQRCRFRRSRHITIPPHHCGNLVNTYYTLLVPGLPLWWLYCKNSEVLNHPVKLVWYPTTTITTIIAAVHVTSSHHWFNLVIRIILSPCQDFRCGGCIVIIPNYSTICSN